jgi:hypothetical protein
LISAESWYIASTVACSGSIDGDVLEIIIVAQIPGSQIFVDRSGVIAGVAVTCVGAVLGHVELVCQSRQQVMISITGDHGHVEVFFWD